MAKSKMAVKDQEAAPPVPESLRAELATLAPTEVEDMTEVSGPIPYADVESLAKVDPNSIFIPEAFTDEGDRSFLKEKALKILDIGRKADYAIKVVVNQVKERATLEIGKELAETYDHFNDRNLVRLPGWGDYLAQLGLTSKLACIYSNAYRTKAKFLDLFGGLVEQPEQLIHKFGDTTLANIQTLLPESEAEKIFAEAAADGVVPTAKEVKALGSQPEVKLTKAQELLAKAKAAKAEREAEFQRVKAEKTPTIIINDEGKKVSNPDYANPKMLLRSANSTVDRLEAEVLKLKQEAQEAKQKAARDAEEKAALEAELEAMKFDDAAAREQRVKRISHTLPNLIPQALADLQRYIAEKVHYESEVQKGIDDQVKTFVSYCQEHYG